MKVEVSLINRLFFTFLLVGLFSSIVAQDLEAILDEIDLDQETTELALFKSTRIVNSHSVKQMKAKELDYRISHRFGQLNTGSYELFGLDHSTIHLSMEYGITDRIMLGFGRSSFQKRLDAFIKIKLTEQNSGSSGSPLSAAWVSGAEMQTLKWPTSENYPTSARLSYVHQLILARKWGPLTTQLTPTLVHRNIVDRIRDPNDLYAIGIGGRYKLTQRLALTLEYFYVLNLKLISGEAYYNPLSFGFDIETGGHVFQLAFSNAIGMREGILLGETTSSWSKGGVRFGFNISRVFSL